MSQLNQIRSHLDRGRTLTPLEALTLFGCMRLAARAAELREQGYPVETTMVKRNGKRVAMYWRSK
ncbi:MAG: hypothetical protein FJ194_19655 [Gammaproteobacteria bacterium]|nr:hypothetical protein [Gammaproteobacteria bacterium]